MKRLPFTLVSILSLAASIALGVLWTLSYKRDAPVWTYLYTGSREGTLSTNNGTVEFYYLGNKRRGTWRAIYGVSRRSWLHQHGFEWTHRHWGDGQGDLYLIRLPIWVIFGLTCILPIIWAVKSRKAKILAKEDRCAICGYDLRATPRRCPECGTETKSPAGAK